MRSDLVREYRMEDITLWLLFSEEMSAEELSEMYALCSRNRQEKSDRIKFDLKRRESIGAGYLLSLLKNKFSIEEEPVLLADGKPVFQNGAVQFSISHSGGAVLLAFGTKPLGVDIEYVKEVKLKIAERFFTGEEYGWIAEQEKERQKDVFCQIWTGKEAVVKAAGGGLTLPLDQFSVLGKRVELLGERYELHQKKIENKEKSLWISAAQLITDERE